MIMFEVKRQFYGRVRSSGETVTIIDRRKKIDQTTHHNVGTTSEALGDKMYCVTTDGHEVRVKNEKYVNSENLEGEWEVNGDHGEWQPLDVSFHPF
jgi:hypothetical protein